MVPVPRRQQHLTSGCGAEDFANRPAQALMACNFWEAEGETPAARRRRRVIIFSQGASTTAKGPGTSPWAGHEGRHR